MMKNVHLAPEADEDDLYSGYNDYNPTFDTEDLENDPAFQQAVKTSHGRRPPFTAKVPGTSSSRTLATGYGSKTTLSSSIGRPVTAAVQDGVARPMTAVQAAGYTKASSRGAAFDPLGQSRGPAPPLETKNEDSPEGKIKQLEKKVNELVEESSIAHSCGDLKLALEKAKDAGRKERALVRQREQTMSPANINLDLTYTVLFNLASQYSANEMYAEALNTYQVIVKNKMFVNGGMLKVNMANIYLKQRNYSKAIKFYRMALDQIASVHKEMRIKIMQNIGIAFIKTGQYTDAISSFEHIMSTSPNLKAGFNLILCYFATGDRDQMKKAFQKLIAVPLDIDDDDKYISQGDDAHTNLLIEAIKNDSLRQMERERKATAEKYIMTAAKLIAPAIETSFAVGYDWCVDVVKTSQYVELANDLEINKAITYLRQKDFNQAVETLKMFEKKDSRVKSAAATNLSFLYFLENEVTQASNYADLAVNSDRYNPAALTNKGNTIFVNGDYEKAAEFYKEALRNDSSCTEALYNIGLTLKKLNRLDEALDSFLKLHAILRNSAQVLFQIASIYELMEDPNQAIEWLMQLISVVPTDSHALAKLGELYDTEGDKSQAFQYYFESYRYFPSNIEVIEWLGAYYIDTQFCEKAIHYFERAALIQPTQVKWQLMVASCYRRSGNYQKALDTYKMIHRKFPDNAECLRFLVRLCTDMGLKETQEYATKLKRVEKLKEIREQRVKSGRDGSARARRDGSASGAALSPESGHNSVPKVVRDPGSITVKGERLNAKLMSLPGTNEPYESSVSKEIDASYLDPLGPQAERPKTALRKKVDEDEFADEDLGDDLLPE
ncbi:intraflagellar transport protein 88 homolog isoform X1 [Anolis sagrei]|uniref:intraflagellar transport protein 88 homolog isoform X1 n=1 Tax=Anolis sagrei TaxID=38937 RepID=UPI00295C2E6E|nr:intraflagellar transport protein 88 homolog isoform X1 [Anolis sagrei ordinatus]XP_060626938.1 intraflagellar transport protein 88 homolog isoform X1 [Anolis sagrei ordinatus]XP_060626940.1 intraflagellar transport protein 88 homolog isoform X1 [Anolis sagrei ordinatus]XP_060626941.1 intraflagellar transport protein 88 homolog isoform X1 [Anolis sagrei ordinatus]